MCIICTRFYMKNKQHARFTVCVDMVRIILFALSTALCSCSEKCCCCCSRQDAFKTRARTQARTPVLYDEKPHHRARAAHV